MFRKVDPHTDVVQKLTRLVNPPKVLLMALNEAAKGMTEKQERALQRLAETQAHFIKDVYKTAVNVVTEAAGQSGAPLSTLGVDRQLQACSLWLHGCFMLYQAEQDIAELTADSAQTVHQWAAAFEDHSNSYSRLAASQSPSTQLKSALLISRAGVDKPALYRAVVMRLNSFRMLFREYVETTERALEAQVSETAKEMAALEREQLDSARGWHEVDTAIQPLQFGVNASMTGGGLTGTIPLRTKVATAVEQLAEEHLKQDLQAFRRMQTPPKAYSKALLEDLDLLNNTSLILAHNHTHLVVEVYEVRVTAARDSGLLRKVGQVAGVSKLPSYLGGRRQKYWTETDILEVVQEAEPSWTLVKTRRSRYKPVKLLNSDIEQDVTSALAQAGHMGGWWNALLKGQPPTPDVNPSGFRSATLMFAVAGLSRWFSWKQQSKAVSWAVFPEAKLSDGRMLTLGNCYIEKHMANGRRMPKRGAAWQRSDHRIDIWANEKCAYWDRLLMWG